MKNSIKILLGAALFSGVVIAASITKFYGDIDMQSHKITNVATPTANADATTKSYVDTKVSTSVATKLDISGGVMSGAINMNGKRVYNLPNPSNISDSATKGYVDNAIASVASGVSAYQYFAMRNGNDYPLIRNFNASNTNYWATFVVLKPFTGKPNVYVEGADCLATNFGAAKTWRVGETFAAELNPSPEAYSQTNGTLIVDAGNGIVGNFGFTFPSKAVPVLRVVDPETGYMFGPDSPVNVGELKWSVVGSTATLTIGITNISTVATGASGISCPKGVDYVTGTQPYPTTVTWSGNTHTCPVIDAFAVNAKRCEYITIVFSSYDSSVGIKWSFDILISPEVTVHFGQFFQYAQ